MGKDTGERPSFLAESESVEEARQRMFMNLLSCLLAVSVAIGTWGTMAFAASLSGEVQIEGRKRLRNLVVYLEAASQATRVEATRHARITQRGRTFSPQTIVIVRGGEVEFVNDEEREIDHNVYSLSPGNKFDIGLASKGVTRKVQFNNPGIVKYFCSVHKNMEGTITVVPSPYYVVVKRPGKFLIRDVPPGDWLVRVSVTHRRYRASPVPVKIAAAPVDNIFVTLSRT